MQIKNVAKFSEDETIKTVCQGTNYAMYLANMEKETFESYKKGELTTITDYQMKDIDVLLVLERLGFKMDELGTYLYKDLIKEVIELFEKNEEEITVISYLTNPFSNIYRWINEYKETGVKTFHVLVIEAINQINTNIIDKKLFIDIFGFDYKELDYGLIAYKIAKYINNINIMTNNVNVSNFKIKKLSNI